MEVSELYRLDSDTLASKLAELSKDKFNNNYAENFSSELRHIILSHIKFNLDKKYSIKVSIERDTDIYATSYYVVLYKNLELAVFSLGFNVFDLGQKLSKLIKLCSYDFNYLDKVSELVTDNILKYGNIQGNCKPYQCDTYYRNFSQFSLVLNKNKVYFTSRISYSGVTVEKLEYYTTVINQYKDEIISSLNKGVQIQITDLDEIIELSNKKYITSDFYVRSNQTRREYDNKVIFNMSDPYKAIDINKQQLIQAKESLLA